LVPPSQAPEGHFNTCARPYDFESAKHNSPVETTFPVSSSQFVLPLSCRVCSGFFPPHDNTEHHPGNFSSLPAGLAALSIFSSSLFVLLRSALLTLPLRPFLELTVLCSGDFVRFSPYPMAIEPISLSFPERLLFSLLGVCSLNFEVFFDLGVVLVFRAAVRVNPIDRDILVRGFVGLQTPPSPFYFSPLFFSLETLMVTLPNLGISSSLFFFFSFRRRYWEDVVFRLSGLALLNPLSSHPEGRTYFYKKGTHPRMLCVSEGTDGPSFFTSSPADPSVPSQKSHSRKW